MATRSFIPVQGRFVRPFPARSALPMPSVAVLLQQQAAAGVAGDLIEPVDAAVFHAAVDSRPGRPRGRKPPSEYA